MEELGRRLSFEDLLKEHFLGRTSVPFHCPMLLEEHGKLHEIREERILECMKCETTMKVGPLQWLAFGQCLKCLHSWATWSPCLGLGPLKKPSKVLANSKCTMGLRKVKTRLLFPSYLHTLLAVCFSLLCSQALLLLTESSWAWRDGGEHKIWDQRPSACLPKSVTGSNLSPPSFTSLTHITEMRPRIRLPPYMGSWSIPGKGKCKCKNPVAHTWCSRPPSQRWRPQLWATSSWSLHLNWWGSRGPEWPHNSLWGCRAIFGSMGGSKPGLEQGQIWTQSLREYQKTQ